MQSQICISITIMKINAKVIQITFSWLLEIISFLQLLNVIVKCLRFLSYLSNEECRMLEFNTLDQFGINIQFSPHDRNLLAFVSGSHYGIQGQGQVSVINFDLTENRIREVKKWICTDVQTDLDWNPKSENIFITSSGDGSIRYNKNMFFW